MADRINLRLGSGDMNVFRTGDKPGERVRVHVAGRHAAALCPACGHPSVDTNGTGWRDVIDVVRTWSHVVGMRAAFRVQQRGVPAAQLR